LFAAARIVLANRSEKAPLMHARAFSFTMLLPTMSNHNVPEEVVTVGLQSSVSSKNLASFSGYSSVKFGEFFASVTYERVGLFRSIVWLTSVGPGINSFLCISLPSRMIILFRVKLLFGAPYCFMCLLFLFYAFHN
jgi:hypothetical protein